jgi:hypothetical protein
MGRIGHGARSITQELTRSDACHGDAAFLDAPERDFDFLRAAPHLLTAWHDLLRRVDVPQDMPDFQGREPCETRAG